MHPIFTPPFFRAKKPSFLNACDVSPHISSPGKLSWPLYCQICPRLFAPRGSVPVFNQEIASKDFIQINDRLRARNYLTMDFPNLNAHRSASKPSSSFNLEVTCHGLGASLRRSLLISLRLHRGPAAVITSRPPILSFILSLLPLSLSLFLNFRQTMKAEKIIS